MVGNGGSYFLSAVDGRARRFLSPSLQEEMMPKAPNTEVGRRIFLLRRLNAVEDALRAIRTRLGPEWKELSNNDRTLLNEILGNVWSETAGETWDSIHFSRMSVADLYRIIDIARTIRSGEMTEHEGTENAVRILTGTI